MHAVAPPPRRETITGLVLAGGRGLRMGGVDKGLQPWRGMPLVDHAIACLAPHVREVMISANRNAPAYSSRAARVLADADDDFAGPLAGILAGLRAAETPWLAVVPCDSPQLPRDLVARLAQAIAPAGAPAALAMHTGRAEPVCCLLSTALADDLERYLGSGERKVERWISRHATPVAFDRAQDRAAFANVNTLADLDD